MITKKRTQVVVLSVIKKEDKYLLTYRRDKNRFMDKKWQIPGGSHEFGETLDETALREAKEELGIDVKIISLIPWIDTKIRNNWQGIFILYLCELIDHNINIQLDNEAYKYGWFTSEEIQNLNTVPTCKESIIEANKIFVDLI